MVDTNKRTDHNDRMNVRSIETCECGHFPHSHDPGCTIRRGAGECPCAEYRASDHQIHVQTLGILTDYIEANGYAPSVRELITILGVSSPATVQDRLGVLERAGFIERKGPRAIKLMEAQQ